MEDVSEVFIVSELFQCRHRTKSLIRICRREINEFQSSVAVAADWEGASCQLLGPLLSELCIGPGVP